MLIVERAGVNFTAGALTANAGQFTEILGDLKEFNSRACAESDISRELFDTALIADQLHDRISKMSTRLSSGGRQVKKRATEQLNSYFASCVKIPGVILNCKSLAGCRITSLNN